MRLCVVFRQNTTCCSELSSQAEGVKDIATVLPNRLLLELEPKQRKNNSKHSWTNKCGTATLQSLHPQGLDFDNDTYSDAKNTDQNNSNTG